VITIGIAILLGKGIASDNDYKRASKKFSGHGTIMAPPPEFNSYCGYGNQWRFPLPFPYHIVLHDEPNVGQLCKYNGKGSLAVPDESSTVLASCLTEIAWNNQYAVFKVQPESGTDVFQWCIFDLKKETIKNYVTEKELYAAMPMGNMELKPLEWFFQKFEQNSRTQKGNNHMERTSPTIAVTNETYIPIMIENNSGKSDPAFYTYHGFRDWYRFPLIYPYQVFMCEELTYGNLDYYDGKGKIVYGIETSVNIISNVIRLEWNEDHAVFKVQPDKSLRYYKWGSLEFKSGKISLYDTKDELYKHTPFRLTGLQLLKWHYDKFERSQ